MADDAVFQEAVEALRAGNKSKARDLLTGLIKTDQNNVTYWVWLSAAMETAKERVYCLQTAIKLDPENATAKRGLILLGALPADETVQPFPVNRPRAWEEKLLLAHEKPKPKGWQAVKQSPVFRLGLVLVLIGLLAGGVMYGVSLQTSNQGPPATPTGPSPTFTASPTSIGAGPQATPTLGTPSGSLAEMFGVQYTPTALYVATERSPLTSDFLLQFDRAFKAGNWEQAIFALQEIIKVEPTAMYAYYYLGESYRLNDQPSQAIDAYNEGLRVNQDYGPLYVGLARARLTVNPNDNVLPLLDSAIRLDPNFGEAYLVRGIVKLRDNDLPGAVTDFGEANTRLPNSPLVFHNLAQAQFRQGRTELALLAAQNARQLDVTLVENYLLLGQIHAANGDSDAALEVLDIYLSQRPEDVSALLLVGRLQFDGGEYEQTIATMNRILSLERTRREAILYRFLSNVELGDGPAANEDLRSVENLYRDSFEANLGILRTHYLSERYGSAEQAVARTEALAESDEQKALLYYWAGLTFEQRNNDREAAKYWQLLLDLPEEVVDEDVRAEAEEHLSALQTPTPTPRVTATRTPTPTRTVTVTPSRTPTPVRTP